VYVNALVLKHGSEQLYSIYSLFVLFLVALKIFFFVSVWVKLETRVLNVLVASWLIYINQNKLHRFKCVLWISARQLANSTHLLWWCDVILQADRNESIRLWYMCCSVHFCDTSKFCSQQMHTLYLFLYVTLQVCRRVSTRVDHHQGISYIEHFHIIVLYI
jgi:hypothetical protein